MMATSRSVSPTMLELWMVTFDMFALRRNDLLIELLVIVEFMIVLLRMVELVAVEELSVVALRVPESTVLLEIELFPSVDRCETLLLTTVCTTCPPEMVELTENIV